jgi:hypothetical protein
MEAATFGRTPPRSGPVQDVLVASLVVVAVRAWAVTGARMDGMDAGPGTELGGLGWFAVVWVTMMAAMMLPSIVPRSSRTRGFRSGSAEGQRPVGGISSLSVRSFRHSGVSNGVPSSR